MSWSDEHKHNILAAFKSVFTFVMLFTMLVAAVLYYDFAHINTEALSFILTVITILFITNYVYDASVIEYRIQKTAERRAQKMIRSSEQLFGEVYSHSPVAYLIVNDRGIITSSNPAAVRLLGIPADTLVTKDFFSITSSHHKDHEEVLRQKFRRGVIIFEEDVEILQGTKKLWTKMSVFQFSDSEGKRLSLVTLVDVTKQKEVETAKSEFVSLASHQLRTPISGMRWSAELLLMDGIESLTEQQRRYVDRLLSSINRMSSLVDDFLQVSRFELGTRVLKIEEVTVSELCEDIISDQAEIASGKRIKVTREFDPAVVKVRTDLGLIRMIITNLYTNAVKYTRVGGQVVVGYEKVSETELQIEVRDTGMGIPVSEQQRVFSKIFRATNAVKEVPDGTGLGLYIVKKAVEQLGGRISFSSSENVGTTFVVVIPLG